jgi:hypothetical protein
MTPPGFARRVAANRSSGGRRRAACALAMLACVAVLAPATHAQRPDPESVQAELERTDDVLQRTADVVAMAGNPRAHDQLRYAEGRQRMAWNQFRQGYPRIALELTLRARELGSRAVRLAQQQGSLQQRAERIVEDAARALERAQNCHDDRASEAHRRMLDLARQQLAQARDALQGMRWEVARGLGLQVMQTVRLACEQGDCPRAETRLDDTQRLYERTAELLPASDRRVGADLDRARALIERGRESLRRSACEAAQAQMRQARDILLRLLRDASGEPGTDLVARVIETTSADVDELRPRLLDAAAIALLDGAERHLDRARELQRDGRLRAALAETRVARNLAGRAARLQGLD